MLTVGDDNANDGAKIETSESELIQPRRRWQNKNPFHICSNLSGLTDSPAVVGVVIVAPRSASGLVCLRYL